MRDPFQERQLSRPGISRPSEIELAAGELFEELEQRRTSLPLDDPAAVVADFAKRLKKLRKMARRQGHAWTAAIEELYTETSAYLKWLRRPKGQPAPFETLEAWISNAMEVLKQVENSVI